MKNQQFLLLCLFSIFSLGWNWETFSIKRKAKPAIKIQAIWTVDTVKEKKLRPQLAHNSPPLITKNLVIQGNSINGIKAYKKDKGQLLWDFKIQSGGVASPVALHKGNIYFGGTDGFFYSLKLETGRLNWKFFTDSENLGKPLIHEDKVYWTANNQKLYALSLKGKLLWIYSGPSLSKGFSVRGRPRPAIYKNWIYTGFYEGSLVALDKEKGKLQWKLPLSPSHTIREDLEISGNCLFVPVFDFYLFCLEPLNGKIRWKTRGGSSSYLAENTAVYQSYKDALYALKKFDGKRIWKKKIKAGVLPLPAVSVKDHLVYGFPSQGKLIFINRKNGKTQSEYKFGRGLAAPVRVDPENKDIYFLSIDGYLHKISIS